MCGILNSKHQLAKAACPGAQMSFGSGLAGTMDWLLLAMPMLPTATVWLRWKKGRFQVRWEIWWEASFCIPPTAHHCDARSTDPVGTNMTTVGWL